MSQLLKKLLNDDLLQNRVLNFNNLKLYFSDFFFFFSEALRYPIALRRPFGTFPVRRHLRQQRF